MFLGHHLCRRLSRRIDDGQIKMSVRILGIDLDRFHDFALAGFTFSRGRENDSQIIMGGKILIINGDRLAENLLGIIKLLLTVVHDPQRGEGKRTVV